MLMLRKSRNVELALRTGVLYRNSPHPIGQLFDLCRISSMHVLGYSNPIDLPLMTDDSRFCAYIHPTSRFPRIECPAALKHTLQIIMYRPPHPTRMQYMSLDPIPLALGGSCHLDANEINGVDEQRERERKMKLVEKLKLHTVHPPPMSAMDSPLLQVLDQINCCVEMSRLLQSNVGLIGTRPKRSLSVSERVVESASTLRNYLVANIEEVVTVWLYPVLRQAFVISLLTHRVIAEVILRILEWRLRPDYAALKDISATAQQVDIRLQQFCYWPFQYLTLRRRRSSWDSVTTSHPDYIRFYNSLWLVANDVILGIAVGLWVIDNAELVAQQINLALSTYTVDGLRRIISWLMDWPAGLKLNNELAAFLGDLFLWVIDYWAGNNTPFLILDTTSTNFSDYRLRSSSSSVTATHHLLHWRVRLCGRDDAHRAVFRSGVDPDGAHLLFLYRLGADLQLAADDDYIVVSSVSRQEAECPTKPDRFVRL